MYVHRVFYCKFLPIHLKFLLLLYTKSYNSMQFFRSKWTALFLSNFLGVFNDNFLKNCIIFVAVNWALPRWMTQSQLISMVSALLVIPYLFFITLSRSLSRYLFEEKSIPDLQIA